MRWKPALNAFAVTFADRWPDAQTYKWKPPETPLEVQTRPTTPRLHRLTHDPSTLLCVPSDGCAERDTGSGSERKKECCGHIESGSPPG